MLKVLCFSIFISLSACSLVRAQSELPVFPLEPTISGEGVENLIRYSLPDGGSRTISLSQSYVVDERLLFLQGLDESRPGLLGLSLLSIEEEEGVKKYGEWWMSERRVDSLPEHYALRLLKAEEVNEILFLSFGMELELPFAAYLVGVKKGGQVLDGVVEALRWDGKVEDWKAPRLSVRSAVDGDVRVAVSDGIHCVKRDGDWHVVDGKRVNYRHVDGRFVLDYFPEGIHQLKVKGLGNLRYSVPVPGHVVFIGTPKDMLKAGKAVSEAEGKRDLLMFNNTEAMEAYYLQFLDKERYGEAWQSGFLGRLMGDKLER